MTAKELLALVQENPPTGTAKQIVTLSLGIHQASVEMDPKTLRSVRDQMPITDVHHSRMKVIGSVMQELTEQERKTLLKSLPDSYGTIHVLCGLKPQELMTAAKTKTISKDMSIRDAREFVKTVRYPVHLSSARPRRSMVSSDPTWKTLLTLHEDPSRPLGEEDRQHLAERIREVIGDLGVEVRHPEKTESIRDLIDRQRAEHETFWRTAMQNELTTQWWKTTDPKVRKQFNLKTIEEFWDTPLRQFTGFLVRNEGDRGSFWEERGRAWVCKVHMEQVRTPDKTKRYYFRCRLEEVFADDTKKGNDLLRWRNEQMRRGGLTPIA